MKDSVLKRFIPADAKVVRSVANGKKGTFSIWFTTEASNFVQSLTFTKVLDRWSLRSN